jgi:hypothetical protein
MQIFRNEIRFYVEELLPLRPTPKPEYHPLSVARDCLFNIIASTLHIGSRSSIRNLRTRHAVVTGTNLSRLVTRYLEIFMLRFCTALHRKWKKNCIAESWSWKCVVSGRVESDIYALWKHTGKRGDHLYNQTNFYTQHSMRGMAGLDQDWILLFQKDSVSLSSMLLGIRDLDYTELTQSSLFK